MASKYLDYDGLLYFWSKIKSAFVAKESGKGLSTNDYTTAEKNKLAGIEAGANAYTHPTYTARTGKPTSNQTPSFGSTFTISQITSDSTGHVTGATDRTVKIPNTSASASSAGLMSSSDFTKLSGIETGAQANVIETVKVNGTALTVTDKAVDIPSASGTSYGVIKVGSVEDLTKDTAYLQIDSSTTGDKVPVLDEDGFVHSGNLPNATSGLKGAVKVDTALSSSSTNPVQNKAINTALGNKANLASPTFTGTPKAPTASAGTNTTQIATTAFVKTAVDNALGSITGISYQVVTSLPTTGSAGVIYLVAHSHGTGDAYDEYIWTGSAYEKIGNTDVDLSGYWAKADLVAITNSEIDTIAAS